ncbi:MAG TPA: TIGR03118 family protein, partial [Pyrinomonadaceae bacterium]
MLRVRPTNFRLIVSLSLTAFLYLCMLPVAAPWTSATLAAKTATDDQNPNVPPIPPGSAYRQTNFVSDIPGFAFSEDPLLVNPWGIALGGTSPFWISNNGTSTASLYRGDVSGSPLVKNPGLSNITIPGGLPTGVVGNATTDFNLTPCSVAACPAAFIFSSETGNIVGWNPSVTGNPTTGVIAASHPGHVYKGLAIGSNSGGNRLYAADFANGNIDVYDGTYSLTTTTGGFVDPFIPAGFNPFNIQNIGGSLYVAYAKHGAGDEPVDGVGNGLVRKFNTDGVRDLTFAINNVPASELNAPWGLAIAPASFGIFGGALLVGNFGEGNPSIHAYNPNTGAFLGTLQNENGDGIEIDELWALQFGNGVNGGDPGTLYFSAGPAEEEHGLFGSLKPTTATATSLIQFATDDFAIGEGSGHIDVSLIRAGDASGTATVNFNTFDESQPGHASQKSDYEIALSKVTFSPGETAKTVRILIVNDNFVEGDEVVNLALSNPAGAGVGLGTPNQAELRIIDNDSIAPTTNPIDDSTFFVRQHYLDFLNREPDSSGLAFWVNQIESCGADAACREVRRINVSAAFFLSIEFQRTGLLAYLTHRAAFGTLTGSVSSVVPVLYGTFERDTQALQKDFIFGQAGSDAQLEANKVAYFNDFVTRPEFVTKYPSTLTNTQYVDNLLVSAGMSPSNFVVNLTNSQENPPTNPTTTGGARRAASYGTAIFNMNAAQTQMTFTATISNIDFTGSQTADTNDNMVAAHIHAAASVTPTTNGPVVWGFFGAPLNDNNPNDVVKTDGPGVGGTISGKWDPPEGNGTTFAAQLANLTGGHAYINFHTTQFGGGEIRGNFPEMSAFRQSLIDGLNAMTDTRATVLRKVAESAFLNQRELNGAFVFMEYAGYLRRDSDVAGFNFWLNKLNSFN